MEDHNQELAPMLPVFKRSHINSQQTFFRALLELDPASRKPPSLLSMFKPKLGWNLDSCGQAAQTGVGLHSRTLNTGRAER